MFRQDLQQKVEQTIMLSILDHVEADAELKKLRTVMSEVNHALRNVVSQEAWEMIMKREELEADYRFKLVENVLSAVGFPLVLFTFRSGGQA